MTQKIVICRFLRQILKFSALWPIESETGSNTKYFAVLIFVSMCFSLVFPYVLLSHMKEMLKANLPMSEDVAALASMFELYFIYFLYLGSQKKIAHTLLEFSRFDVFEKPDHFDELNEKLDKYAKMLLAYCIIGLFNYSFLKLFGIPKCRERNIHENCGFVVPSTTPKMLVFSDDPLLFLSYYVFETVYTQVFIKVTLVISYQVWELSQHLTLRINHLNKMITECFQEESPTKARALMNKCIAYHIRIIEDSNRVNDCFSNPMFSHLTVTSIVLGCIIYHLMEGFDVGFIPFVLAWTFALFIACLAGQEISDSSETISEAAYNANWYEADLSLQKDLILYIKQSQSPLLLWAGRFSPLTFPLFVSIMKTSYSCLTILTG